MFNIIVVEENVPSCHQMVQALIDSGYEVEMAFNTQEAMKKIGGKDYDLVLTQLASAQVDGYEILKKAKGKNKSTIVIVITDKEESHTAFEAINRGAHGFIEKPFSSAQLILEIRGALEKRSLSSGWASGFSKKGARLFPDRLLSGGRPARSKRVGVIST